MIKIKDHGIYNALFYQKKKEVSLCNTLLIFYVYHKLLSILHIPLSQSIILN